MLKWKASNIFRRYEGKIEGYERWIVAIKGV